MSEAAQPDSQASAPKLTNVADLYRELSARITETVVNHTTSDWPNFFVGLRALVHRVLTDTPEDVLSGEDRAALVSRLMEHLAELERAWPSLGGKLQTLKPDQT